MASPISPKDVDILVKFGAGLHTRASEDEIDDREAADGSNFLLDLETKELKPRPPFDLIATAPNESEIRGGGSLLKSDGTVKSFIQAGNKVYQFTGTAFTASPVLDTVSASSKLRGHWRSHNWTLDDKVIVTDLALIEPVKDWDGTTWADIAFLSAPSVSFGEFRAKYCAVANERAFFANVQDAGGATPQLLVGSKRGDHKTISVSDRPSSSLSDEDPFFITTPDLKPINGLIEAFRALIISTEKGKIFNLAGESATDFSLEDFFPGSAASGDESVCWAGNDVIYGRQGRLESIRNIDQFGDTEADDLSKQIADIIRAYTGWRVVYNSRLNRVYAFPTSQSEVWVFNTSMMKDGLSPWMRWVTQHPLAFQPTFVDSMLNPADGLEYVYMGDEDGNLYVFEGDGTEGDGGQFNIALEYLTKLFSLPLNAEAYEITGYVRYRTGPAATVRLTFEYAGHNIFTDAVEITIPAAEGGAFYGGEFYYGGDVYYGSVTGKLKRQTVPVAGRGNEFQVRVQIEGVTAPVINEIGLIFTAVRKSP